MNTVAQFASASTVTAAVASSASFFRGAFVFAAIAVSPAVAAAIQHFSNLVRQRPSATATGRQYSKKFSSFLVVVAGEERSLGG